METLIKIAIAILHGVCWPVGTWLGIVAFKHEGSEVALGLMLALSFPLFACFANLGFALFNRVKNLEDRIWRYENDYSNPVNW